MSTGSKTRPKPSDVPFLELTAGNGWGRTFELSRKKLSIGRTTDNEIVLDSTSVSRVHAVLKETARGWSIEDNLSKNGIWVNGIAVKKAVLRGGDVIQLGEYVFRFCDPAMNLEIQKRRAEEISRSLSGAKTEVISTDTWNVAAGAPEKPPVPPPVEEAAPPPPPPPPAYTPPPRPRVNTPARPVALGNFGKNQQEKLYLALGLVGGLLVGSLLYMRLQKSPPPTQVVIVPATPSASKGKEPVPAQEAFRKIAEQTEEAKEEEARVVEKKAPPPAKRKEAQALVEAAEEVKRPAIKPEDLNMSVRKKDRVARKDIGMYLEEGKAYLRDGDFESASLAFKFALVIDPNNTTAKGGLTAAQRRKKTIVVDDGAVVKAAREAKAKAKEKEKEKAADRNAEKRATVSKLLKSAVDSLKRRRYQEAAETAEKARQIEISGETAYLNEAKQIIDRAAQRQKEEFEPFMELATRKLKEGDFRGSILLCEEMLRTDPGYAPAKDCMERSTAGLAAGAMDTKSKPEGVQ